MADREYSEDNYNGVRGNGVTIESVPNCYNNNQICNKAVDNYPNALKFSPD